MPQKTRSSFITAFLLLFSAPIAWAEEAAAAAAPAFNTGDTAWVLASAALVMLMTPGLGLFYGGMVRRKNVLGTILQSLFLVALIGVQWVVIGYSLSFAPGGDFLGSFAWKFLDNLPAASPVAPTIPHVAFIVYQAMFAIITPALICGAFAERVKFGGFVLFSLLWATFVYDPVAYAVWGGGLLSRMGGIDFAGGAVVHITAGFSALALAVLLGTRRGYGKDPMTPHNMTMVLTGTGLLWFGWFGFNGGSALGANGLASNAFLTTHSAGSMAALVWVLIESLHRGKPTALGAATGAIAGLAAVTPAAGFVDVKAALWIGAISSLLGYGAILLKVRMGYDDSLDAFGVHGVGGFWGVLATGLWANPAIGGKVGWFYGNAHLFKVQFQMAVIVALFSLGATFLLYLLVEKTVGFRAHSREEELGLDLSQHGEEGYGTADARVLS